MNKILNIILLSSLSILISGCYSKEELTSELGEPHHKIVDSQEPVDKYIYTQFKNTGVCILYDFSTLDYKWNLNVSNLSEYEIVKQTDKAILSSGISYLDKVLWAYYDNDFKKKFFPLNILLCDSIKKGTVNSSIATITGRNYLAIGKISKGIENTSEAELNNLKGIINGNMWGNIFYTNSVLDFPQEFFTPCEELYGYKIGTKTDVPAFDSKKLGFWDKDPDTSTSSTYMAPRKPVDVVQFIQQITTNSYEEIMVKMNGYPILYNKYIILTNYMKEHYNIDLQAIGNNKPTKIK